MFKIIHKKIKNAINGCLLQSQSQHFSLQLFDSISKVNKGDWQQIISNDVFWSVAYHEALEKGCNPSVSFRYVIIYKEKNPVGVFYFQLIDLKNRSVNQLLNHDYFAEILAKMNGRSNDFVFGGKDKSESYLCICGNLFVSGNFGICINDNQLFASLKTSFSTSMDLLEDSIAADASIFATAIKDYKINDELISVFDQMNFTEFEIDPDMVLTIDPNWNSYEDYLNTFASKYRVRANNAAAKSTAIISESWGVTEIKKHSVEIEALFEAVLAKAPVRLASNTTSYFENLKSQLGENFIFKAFLLNDELIAFSTAVVCSEGMHAHHIGFNYDLNKKYALYQNLLYDFVKEAILLKKRFLNFGRDAMEIKSTIGAEPVRLKLFVRFSNSITQLILDSFLKLAKPKTWTQRRPFRSVDLEPINEKSLG